MKDLLQPEMVIYDFDPRNLPAELQTALGLVVAAAAHTEGALQQMIAGLLSTNMVHASAVAAQMSTPQKLDVIRSIVELNAPSVTAVDEADDIIDAIQAAMELRNGLVHCLFGRHPNTGEVIRMKNTARGSVVIKVDPVAVHEIEDIANKIYRSGIALIDFMTEQRLEIAEFKGARWSSINRKPAARAKRKSDRDEAKP